MISVLCLSLGLAAASFGCGDDDDDKDDGVSVQTPGADVNVKADAQKTAADGAAGSAANTETPSTPAQR
jgi:hypothetical protein